LGDDVVQLRTRVDGVSRSGPRRFHVATAKHSESALFDGVILATSTSRSSNMLGELDSELAERLSRIEYASSAVVTLVFRRDQIGRPLDGFGAVVPTIENSPMIAASFLNVKFPHSVPADHAVIRVFCGGVLRPELVHRDDAWLIEMATLELAELIDARGKPVETHVTRWVHSMPQYEVGHLQLVKEIEHRAATHHALQLCGSGYRGVGIPQCVQSGQGAAERLVKQLAD
jgi:oxygen-dependent protoporphyrinogen oxidase